MILGAILAGGRARRFGGDKALAEWRGMALIDHVATALAPHVNAIAVCGREHGTLTHLNDRPASDLGPLGGLNAAIAHAATHGFERVLAVPCDTPSLDPKLLKRLIAQPTSTVVSACPVIGIWSSALSGALDAFLATSGDRSLRSWATVAGARTLEWNAPHNINRPDDLLQLDG